MLPHDVDQAAKQVLLCRKALCPRSGEAGKELCKAPCQNLVTRNGAYQLDRTHDFLFYFAGHEMWIEIDHAPPTRIAT
jgi:hypothetical protein